MTGPASVWGATTASVLLVSLLPLVGLLALGRNEARMRSALIYLVSFAVGALLGVAILDLIPEAYARLGATEVSVGLLTGFVGFLVLEKYLWSHHHELKGGGRPLALVNLLGDGLHNFMDGMIIAASYATDMSLGVSTTVAVLLHEVPQELGDFGILVYGGLSARRATALNLASGLTALLGAALTLALGRHFIGLATTLLPIAAGGFLYIAASDLVPEIKSHRSAAMGRWQILLVLLGIGVIGVLRLVA